MKKNYLLTKNTMAVIILLCCVFFPSLVYSQTEWLWAKSYYGTGNMNNETNEIIRAGFDSYGNVYIYGRLVGSTMFDGAPFLSGISGFYGHGSILAKIDPLGNVVWVRPVKGTGGSYLPLWMEIQNDQICVFGTVQFPISYEGSTEKLYYFDTLVNYLDAVYIPEEERELPFYPGLAMNYMTVFDMDGNIVKQNFLQLADKRYPTPSYFRTESAPFHIGQDENTYIATALFSYYQNEGEKQLDIIINNEKRFNVSYPIRCAGQDGNSCLVKFSPDFDLLWVKQLISHTTALIEENGESHIDTVPLYCALALEKLTCDQDGNMYLIGKAFTPYVLSPDSVRTCDGRIVDFPIDIYLDSVHHIHMKDFSSDGWGLPFIIKFDTAGNILWANQLYTTATNFNVTSSTKFYDAVVSGDDVFVSGYGKYIVSMGFYTYFDKEETIRAATYHENHSDNGFIAKYDKISGEYITHVPIHSGVGCQQIAIVNNHLTLIGGEDYNCHVLKFRDDLTLMSVDTILATIPVTGKAGGVCAHESGYLFSYFHVYQKNGTFNFSPSVQATAALGSSAVFALQYDPSLSIPYEYVGISEYDKAASISVYPNPVQHILYIGIDDPIIQFKEAELFSLTGQKIGKYTNQIIPVENLSSGLYLLRISTDKGSYVKKFTKN